MAISREQREYSALVAEFQAVTMQWKDTNPGEEHNTLTRKRNELRAKIQDARLRLPEYVNPPDSMAHVIVDERTSKVTE